MNALNRCTLDRSLFDKAGNVRLGHCIVHAEPLPSLDPSPPWGFTTTETSTHDDLPIVGHGGVPGLIHAGGLFRNGILLGPLIGEAAAQLALGRAPAIDISAWSPSRFT